MPTQRGDARVLTRRALLAAGLGSAASVACARLRRHAAPRGQPQPLPVALPFTDAAQDAAAFAAFDPGVAPVVPNTPPWRHLTGGRQAPTWAISNLVNLGFIADS